MFDITLCDDGTMDTVVEWYCDKCNMSGEQRGSAEWIERDENGAIDEESWEDAREELADEHECKVTDDDVKTIVREYSAIDHDTYDGPVTIMLSSGYAELWSDGEVTQHGTVIYRVEGWGKMKVKDLTDLAYLPGAEQYVKLHCPDMIRIFLLRENKRNHGPSNYDWLDVTNGAIPSSFPLCITAIAPYEAMEHLYTIYRHTCCSIESIPTARITRAQYKTLKENAERWNKPELARYVIIINDEDSRVTGIGFWTGENGGEGMYIGIEPDGYAHS